MRVCRKCAEERDESAFRRGRVCRECERAYDRDRYARDTEKRRALIDDWKRRHPEAQATYSARRRAVKLSVENARIAPLTLQQRMSVYAGCWICGDVIQSEDLHYDHVKPLSAGGSHMLSNLRPAHSWCNLVKGSRWLGVGRLDELRYYVVMRVNELMRSMSD